jgi:hypothetical protein
MNERKLAIFTQAGQTEENVSVEVNEDNNGDGKTSNPACHMVFVRFWCTGGKVLE